MKYIEKLQELVHEELDDYSYFKGWYLTSEEKHGDEEYYTLNIKVNGKEVKEVAFRVTSDKIEVENGEDCWNETNTYNHRVKYFWMALLSWDYT